MSWSMQVCWNLTLFSDREWSRWGFLQSAFSRPMTTGMVFNFGKKKIAMHLL
jgi:hypothetical protein